MALSSPKRTGRGRDERDERDEREGKREIMSERKTDEVRDIRRRGMLRRG